MAGKLKPPDKRTPTCFGMPHKGFFQFFVIVNMAQNILCVGLTCYDIKITIVALLVVEVEPYIEKITFYLRAVAWVWYILQCIVSFGMDIHLYRTSTLPNTSFLRFYAILHAISLPLFVTFYNILLMLGGNSLPRPPVLASVMLPGHVLYRVYTSYVVYRYSRDIECDLKMKSGYRSLTNQEIGDFEMGLESGTGNSDSTYEMAKFQAFDRAKFEINEKDLDFSEAITLGFGEYGSVYKVNWKGRSNGEGSGPVAVKTVDPEMSDVHQFKALLMEAKVMMYMGRHENIVGLLGVCTEHIRERKLYIVCELCAFGNLRAHLRSERNTFVNLFSKVTEEVKLDMEISSAFTTVNLLRWAAEIAAGMEFLALKKIIHGDLAARNVLLTSSKVAKITDFGLSRRLYNYSVYNKRNDVPLPWRWLALESLVDMSFSTASDVWSFGICCWEIFELGARPWPEYPLFNSEFIDALKDGSMPSKGENCSKDIHVVMCMCWNREESTRPNFTLLKDYFSRKMTDVMENCNQVVKVQH